MLVFLAAGSAFSQNDTTKKRNGKDFSAILPQAGNFALGLNMAQFIKSINNSITNAAAGNMITAFEGDFFGKYFLTDRSALRVRLGVGVNNSTVRRFVRDDAENLRNPSLDNPLTEAKTVDVQKLRNTDLILGIGYEYRRSLWRVQGYAGAEVFGGVGLYKERYEYGNPITAVNQTPTTFAFTTIGGYNGYRPLESVKGNAFMVGAAIFFGADLFVCKNLSLGAEFNLEGRYSRTGELGLMTETWFFDQTYKTEEKVRPVSSSFRLIPSGRFNLSVYF